MHEETVASEFSYQFIAGTANFAVVLIDNYGVLNRVQKDIFECDPSNITLANLHVCDEKMLLLKLNLFFGTENLWFQCDTCHVLIRAPFVVPWRETLLT